MKNVLFTVMLASLIACQTTKTETETTTDSVAVAKPNLTLKWETDTVLTTCESVIYDQNADMLYVSNINGAPDTKDGNGFISKVNLEGKVVEVKWITGIDAPKGMGLHNGKLFVTDIDKIHEIDIASGKITKTHAIADAKFLNDVTVDADGKVYISDMMSGDITLLEKGKLSKWMTNVNGPNGLFARDNNELIMLSWNDKSVNVIDSAKQVVMKTDSIDNPDGVEAVGNGAYLVSSWNGMIHYVDHDWNKKLLLDTRSDSVSSADIEFIPEKNLLLVPTFFNNKVMAYELNK